MTAGTVSKAEAIRRTAEYQASFANPKSEDVKAVVSPT
jgi:hypothetical protein